MIQIPRRAATVLAGTAVVTVLLFTFKTPAELLGGGAGSTVAVVDGGRTVAGATPAPVATLAPDTGSTGSSDGSSGTAATPVPSAPTTTTGTTEVAGSTVSTRFGPVQVKIVISGGSITDVVALQLPSGGRSGQISNIVEPMLHDQALTAQSAAIDGVSGATYTSRAYAQSLQAALDQAGI